MFCDSSITISELDVGPGLVQRGLLILWHSASLYCYLQPAIICTQIRQQKAIGDNWHIITVSPKNMDLYSGCQGRNPIAGRPGTMPKNLRGLSTDSPQMTDNPEASVRQA
ncbi:hypothetical protein AOLI_G00144690 [Acnodon oligacanthus]